MDYSEYQLSFWEKGKIVLVSGGIAAVVAFLFYRSFWGLVLWPLLYVLVKKRMRQQLMTRRMETLREHFMNGMQVLNTSLQAGLSMENAWREVQKETLLLYGEGSEFYQEIREINQTVTFNMPIERLFLDFARRSGEEEILRFAEMFDYGKRSGGNWKKIIENTVLRMWERYETQKEIEVMLAAKQIEQKVMNLVPLGMLFFLQMASWDYMQVLYHNFLGIICMSICLAGYGAAIVLSEKIMKIQV